MKLPIFPLSIYLLPGGITRLRIFEQRYIRMVRNAEKTKGFVISYYQNNDEFNISSWGSWVDIIDFELGDDGFLVIDVKCKSLVDIINCQKDDDNLLQAEIEMKAHWPNKSNAVSKSNLTDNLHRLFAENHELSNMYKGHFNKDLAWVCARWLELLPVNFTEKSLFVEHNSFDSAVEFLTTLIIDKNKRENIL